MQCALITVSGGMTVMILVMLGWSICRSSRTCCFHCYLCGVDGVDGWMERSVGRSVAMKGVL